MGSEIMNAVTIYEINGMKYNGPRTINVTSHPRFLNFVRLCIDNREYSLGADDLMRAVDRVIGQPLAPEDEALVGEAVERMNKFVEKSAAGARQEEPELPPR
jgi:hypothetical protein